METLALTLLSLFRMFPLILFQSQLCPLRELFWCQSRVFTKPSGGLKKKLGNPDLMIFFTSTMSHKMVYGALNEIKGQNTIVERCHTSSLSALRGILEKYAGQKKA